jgi:hypothetical protein
MIGENLSTLRNNALSTTNPTWTGLSLNPGLHSDRQVPNNLSHDTAQRGHVVITNRAKFIHTAVFSVVALCIFRGRYKYILPLHSEYSHNQQHNNCQYDENLKPNTEK